MLAVADAVDDQQGSQLRRDPSARITAARSPKVGPRSDAALASAHRTGKQLPSVLLRCLQNIAGDTALG